MTAIKPTVYEAQPGNGLPYDNIEECLLDVRNELIRAQNGHGSFNSAHEGWAVIKEELDELWEHVCMKQSKRNPEAMRVEAMQVAAMAIRFMYDIYRRKERV